MNRVFSWQEGVQFAKWAVGKGRQISSWQGGSWQWGSLQGAVGKGSWQLVSLLATRSVGKGDDLLVQEQKGKFCLWSIKIPALGMLNLRACALLCPSIQAFHIPAKAGNTSILSYCTTIFWL
jgi:hypothetical protein